MELKSQNLKYKW